jgi:DNA (cytosine-5)-methyltransferase 1
MTVKIGSLFAGIGGFELGIERAIPNSETIWQVEQNPFCQSILSKHWPKAKIYNDVRDITINNVEPVDVLLGGFPCQDISTAGKQKGVKDGKKSSLWWEMWRIIGDIRPRVVIMENVANIIRLGGPDVVGSLTKIGYDCEWTIVSARQFGAPHLRERWFCVAYSESARWESHGRSTQKSQKEEKTWSNPRNVGQQSIGDGAKWPFTTAHTNSQRHQTSQNQSIQFEIQGEGILSKSPGGAIPQRIPTGTNTTGGHWSRCKDQPIICGVDDGIPNWLDRDTKREHNQRLQALGNAIVPQCSQWVGEQVLKSGLLDDLLGDI